MSPEQDEDLSVEGRAHELAKYCLMLWDKDVHNVHSMPEDTVHDQRLKLQRTRAVQENVEDKLIALLALQATARKKLRSAAASLEDAENKVITAQGSPVTQEYTTGRERSAFYAVSTIDEKRLVRQWNDASESIAEYVRIVTTIHRSLSDGRQDLKLLVNSHNLTSALEH